jgi:hypothetical protein
MDTLDDQSISYDNTNNAGNNSGNSLNNSFQGNNNNGQEMTGLMQNENQASQSQLSNNSASNDGMLGKFFI